ncbi:MAG: hypothetical protein CVU56_24010 [Deltaproteobacteria bacterium HGW-Deltaproteobacteria-14]|jgi:DNA-binding transcriptional LysR family regulator|nr:MAG: hypothetical protein CVU56_24010 [Deltaproteobacteria bacterium HGW-Deltaproteobacteria-14]
MRQLDDLNWDDLRVFTVLVEAKSLREAAERLRLTHPTVRRRLDALEASLGLRLFHRRQSGLRLTVEGADLVEAGLEVESAVRGLLRRAESVDQELKGPIRVTVAAELALALAPALAEFQRQWPALELRIETANAFADLSRSEADVALRGYRHGGQPPDHLAGRLAVSGSAAVYGDAASTPWWIGAQHDAPRSGWTATAEFADLPVRAVIPDVLVRHTACAAGMGIAAMPCLLGGPDLPRLTDPVPDFDIWVLVHPDLRRNPRLRVFRDAMVDAIRDLESVLQGRTAV